MTRARRQHARSRTRATILAGFVLGLALFASAGPLVPASARAAAKAVTVTPNTALGDAQFVQVSWSGFGSFVFFRQCTQSPTNVLTDCTKLYSFPGYSNGSGAGVAYEQVSMGDVKNGNSTTFRCDVSTPCSFGVFSDSTLASGAFATLQFAPTADSCPDPNETTEITGSGADEPNLAIYRWSTQVCQPPSSLPVGYLSQNSIDGRENFMNSLADFAVTETPFTDAEKKKLAANRQTYAYAPITASGLVLAFKMFDHSSGEQGPQILSLKLTPALVAGIFTGKIVNWSTNADIKALNPGVSFPPTEMPLVRGDHSAANQFFTGWLTATAKGSLPDDWPGATVDYPMQYLNQVSGIDGGDRLAHAMADPTTLDQLNSDFSTIGYIGYMDASEAAYYGLPTVQIQNAAGNFVAPTNDSILAGISVENKVDGMLQPNYTSTNPDAYPMPLVSYVAAPTDLIDYHKGATLENFIKYGVADGQQPANLPIGYVPLTQALVDEANTVAAEIPDQEGEGSPPPPSPTPTPTPSPSPSPSPIDTSTPTYPPVDTSSPTDYPSGGFTDGGSTCTVASPSPTAGASPSPSGSASPSPSPSGSPSPSPSPSGKKSPSPSPSPSGKKSPSPSPSPSGKKSPSPSPNPSASPTSSLPVCTAAALPTLPTNGFAETAARFVLPSLAGIGILAMLGGFALELSGRRGSTSLLTTVGRRLSQLPLPTWLRP